MLEHFSSAFVDKHLGPAACADVRVPSSTARIFRYSRPDVYDGDTLDTVRLLRLHINVLYICMLIVCIDRGLRRGRTLP